VDGQMLATDADGDTLIFSIIVASRNGSVVLTDVNTGDFTYTPNANFTGTDRFFFRVSDGAASSNFAFVTVTVTPSSNSTPVAQNGSVTTNENTAVAGTLLAGDDDGDPLSFSITSQGSLGSAVITNPATGAFTYTPNQNATGTDSFNFVANDGSTNSNTATIIVTIIPDQNAVPVAQAGSEITNEDAPVSGNLVANDADGDALTYSIDSQGSLGTAVITNAATGAFTYSPNANANGTDTFSFIANDGTENSNIATITISIAAVNDAPMANNGSANVSAGNSVAGTLVANDIDGDALTFSISVPPSQGSVVVTNPATGAFTYTANSGASGSDSFSFVVNDGAVNSNVATVAITINGNVNVAPVAQNSTITTAVNTPVSGNMIATDANGDTLTYSIIVQGRRGTVVIDDVNTGAFTYTPKPGATGIDRFFFRVSDGTTNSNFAFVTVTINP
jgi:hypothetical protein